MARTNTRALVKAVWAGDHKLIRSPRSREVLWWEKKKKKEKNNKPPQKKKKKKKTPPHSDCPATSSEGPAAGRSRRDERVVVSSLGRMPSLRNSGETQQAIRGVSSAEGADVLASTGTPIFRKNAPWPSAPPKDLGSARCPALKLRTPTRFSARENVLRFLRHEYLGQAEAQGLGSLIDEEVMGLSTSRKFFDHSGTGIIKWRGGLGIIQNHDGKTITRQSGAMLCVSSVDGGLITYLRGTLPTAALERGRSTICAVPRSSPYTTKRKKMPTADGLIFGF